LAKTFDSLVDETNGLKANYQQKLKNLARTQKINPAKSICWKIDDGPM